MSLIYLYWGPLTTKGHGPEWISKLFIFPAPHSCTFKFSCDENLTKLVTAQQVDFSNILLINTFLSIMIREIFVCINIYVFETYLYLYLDYLFVTDFRHLRVQQFRTYKFELQFSKLDQKFFSHIRYSTIFTENKAKFVHENEELHNHLKFVTHPGKCRK